MENLSLRDVFDKLQDVGDVVEIVKDFILKNPNKLNEYGVDKHTRKGTLLHVACIFNRIETVKYLLSLKPNCSLQFRAPGSRFQRLTPLRIAGKQGHTEIVQLFREEEQRQREAEEKNKIETKEQSQIESEEKRRKEGEEQRQREAEEKKKIEKEEQSQREAEEKRRKEGEELIQREAEERRRREEEEKRQRETELKAAKEKAPTVFNWFKGLNFDIALQEQYAQLFVEQGYDDLDVIVHMQEKTLQESFSLPKGHVTRIWLAIQTLKQSQQSDPIVASASPSPISVQASVLSPSSTPSREQRRREPLTARHQPGRRFLSIVPKAPISKPDIIQSLLTFANNRKPPLDTMIITQFQDKIEDFSFDGHPPDTAISLALCWLYTTDSWVYQQTNFLLREDSSVMEELAPFMNGLMKSFKSMDPKLFYSGNVYRRSKLTEQGIGFYKPGVMFIWSSFSSTTVEFSENNLFGDVLFVISVPEDKKPYALCLETISVFPQEREVLLLPNVGFVVKSVKRGAEVTYANTTVVIDLEVAYACV